VTVEFNRDILPVLNESCVSCHTDGVDNGGLILDGVGESDAWGVLTNTSMPDGKKYKLPQRSRYIRIPQARESLLVWVAYEARLDGRSNEARDDDIDYPSAHPKLGLSDKSKRTIARWVDLGSPIDFPKTNGFGYTDDNQLPVINVHSPQRGYSPDSTEWSVGFIDAKSGIDVSTVKIEYAKITNDVVGESIAVPVELKEGSTILSVPRPGGVVEGNKYLITVSVKDRSGNLAIDRRRVAFMEPPSKPSGSGDPSAN